MKHTKRRSGFSLVEVVVSVGIFAVAIVGIIGLFAPTTKNVAAVADSDASTRVVAAIQQSLKETASTSAGFNNMISAIGNGTFIYYANKGGDKVDRVTTNGGCLSVVTNKSEAFFEFSLTRNSALSPSAVLDASAGFLAFTITLRWPAYLPTADGITGTPVTDNSQKSMLIVPTAVTR